MTSITATWRPIADAEILQRSSQVLSVVNNKAYIFGGELKPREPRDNLVHAVDIVKGRTNSSNDGVTSIAASSPSPSPRVGSAAASLGGKFYLFSGRGGPSMAPIDEKGVIWGFDPRTSTWVSISPSSLDAPYPLARSYHAIASDGEDKLYLHAGCPATGRLSDLWSFSLSSRTWTELAAAPAPARGGTSIAFSNGLIYRMNGFDGKTEQGGLLDIYSPSENSWHSVSFTPDDISGPSPRSVSALLALRVDEKEALLTLFGERDPSSVGHAGAGKMARDVWLYDVSNNTWNEVQVGGEGERPVARGWFAADVTQYGKRVVVQGGLNEENERLGDVWVLEF